jgi:hypothetical protein
MEKNTVTSHIIKGIVIAAVLMLLNFVVRRQGGVALPVILQLLPTLLLLAGIIGSCLLFGAQTRGTMPRGDIFAHGFKTTAMVTFLVAVYTFIIVKFVFPHSASEIEDAVKIMVQKDNRMEQEARRIAEDGFKRAWIFDVGGAIFATLITGLAGSFIGAALAKKKP